MPQSATPMPPACYARLSSMPLHSYSPPLVLQDSCTTVTAILSKLTSLAATCILTQLAVFVYSLAAKSPPACYARLSSMLETVVPRYLPANVLQLQRRL